MTEPTTNTLTTMKTFVIVFILHTFCYIITAHAQQQIQGGIYVGGINYEGDLAPSSFIVSFSETHLDLGAFMYLQANNWLALKINYHHGTLSGSDINAIDVGRRNRNLHFRSPLDELSASSAFFYTYNFRQKRIIKPFFTLGIGVFRFNPKAEYEGKWYDLQPLSTEGQGLSRFPERKPYKKIQVCFPLGTGVQWTLGKRVELTIDLSLRKTLTDYIDDVSMTYVPLEDLRKEREEMAAILSNRILSKDALQHSLNQSGRGDPKYKDWYLIGSIGIVAHILGKSKRDSFFQKKKNYLNCKRIYRNM